MTLERLYYLTMNALVYLLRVFPKHPNGIPDPLKSQCLVHEPLVARYFGVINAQEAEHAQPVVDGDNHNFIVNQEVWTILSTVTS